jgi:UPF0755 protein
VAVEGAGLPLKTPYEALILASDRGEGDRSRRRAPADRLGLRQPPEKSMRLQTDPTVIYGMGDAYDGNIRKKDLTPTRPGTTYTRDGLPPTPIAMPGPDRCRRRSTPAESDMLYFVGKGDGTHQFSRTLEEHNRAVTRYQLKR